ncbi:hypothetical protein TrST_g10796 [Triparma strigata]|uniref:Uncharacterized protein n=1 Tax=Triparma strigata TaxID=1606541 RepID=A0A9W7C7K4_9STRA|nr:hypothetical protein TrST_g10796 [Triparma strigata]
MEPSASMPTLVETDSASTASAPTKPPFTVREKGKAGDGSEWTTSYYPNLSHSASYNSTNSTNSAPFSAKVSSDTKIPKTDNKMTTTPNYNVPPSTSKPLPMPKPSSPQPKSSSSSHPKPFSLHSSKTPTSPTSIKKLMSVKSPKSTFFPNPFRGSKYPEEKKGRKKDEKKGRKKEEKVNKREKVNKKFHTKIHFSGVDSPPSSLLSPNHSALSSTISSAVPISLLSSNVDSVEICLFHELRKNVGSLMKDFTVKYEGGGLKVEEAGNFLNTFLGISQSNPAVKATIFSWKNGRFVQALTAFTADLRWSASPTALTDTFITPALAIWALTPEPSPLEKKENDATKAIFGIADNPRNKLFFKNYPTPKHLSCRRMALLLLNFICTEPLNKEGLIKLGVIDVALKQILIDPKNVRLSLILTNLSILPDHKKVELLANDSLQILETAIYALKNIGSDTNNESSNLDTANIEADVKNILERDHKKSVTNLTIVSSDLSVVYELGSKKQVDWSSDAPQIRTTQSDDSTDSDNSVGATLASETNYFFEELGLKELGEKFTNTISSSLTEVDNFLGTLQKSKNTKKTPKVVDEGVDSDDSDNSEATLKTKDFDEEQDALDRKEPPRSAINSDGKYTSTSGPKRTKITAKMLLEAQSSRLSNGEPLSFVNGVAMGWYVAVIRNITRFDELEQVPIEIVAKIGRILVEHKMERTLMNLIYPNLSGLSTSLSSSKNELMRHAENEWGLNTTADHALDTLVNLSAFDEFRSYLRKSFVHIHMFKIFKVCQERFDINAIRNKPSSDPSWTNTSSNLVMTGIKAKIITSLLTRSKVTFEFGINLGIRNAQQDKYDTGAIFYGAVKNNTKQSSYSKTVAPRNLIIDNSTAQILNTILFKIVSATYPPPPPTKTSRTRSLSVVDAFHIPHDVTISGILRCIRTLISRNHKIFADPKLYGGDLYMMLVKIIAKRALFWKDGRKAAPAVSSSLCNDAIFCLFALSIDNLKKGQVPEPLTREVDDGGTILGLVLYSASCMPDIDHKAYYQLTFLLSVIPTIKRLDKQPDLLRISENAEMFTQTCAELQAEMHPASSSYVKYMKALEGKKIQEETELRIEWDNKNRRLSELVKTWLMPVISKPVEDRQTKASKSETNVTMYASPFAAALGYSNGNEMCPDSFHTVDAPVLNIAQNIAVAASNPLFVVYGKQWKWISEEDYDILLAVETANMIGPGGGEEEF